MIMQAESGARIVYDGQCPFCSRYARRVRLEPSLGPVELVDARQGGPLVDEVFEAGFDLDDGMVLKLDGRFYHGVACIHMLALLSTPSSAFSRINAALFRSRSTTKLMYPMLRASRSGALRLLGRTKITHPMPDPRPGPAEAPSRRP